MAREEKDDFLDSDEEVAPVEVPVEEGEGEDPGRNTLLQYIDAVALLNQDYPTSTGPELEEALRQYLLLSDQLNSTGEEDTDTAELLTQELDQLDQRVPELRARFDEEIAAQESAHNAPNVREADMESVNTLPVESEV